MRRIISALIFSFSTALACAQAGKPLELASDAPERHIVVPGDTLWGIAAKFLKDPYRWAELWKLNAADIKNPQRIYPGQVLVLDKSGSEPQLKLETVKLQQHEYVESLKKPIPSIPPKDIEPFLAEPRVIDAGGMESAPRVVGLQDNRVIAGTGDDIYVVGVTENAKLWQVFRPGKTLVDPETKAVLGYEALHLGSARMMREGSPATFKLLTSKQEILPGDRLMPAPRIDVVSYLPRAPQTQIAARVVSIYNGVSYGGPQMVVTLNRGKADGVEAGHVLAVDLAGPKIDNRYQGEKTTYTLPDTRNGLIFVFRVFDHVSYGLVMSAVKPVLVGDLVRTP